MIDIKCDHGEVECAISGSLEELCTDTIILIKYIYESICKHDSEAGQRYKNMMTNNHLIAILPFVNEEQIGKLANAVLSATKAVISVSEMAEAIDNDEEDSDND